MMDIEQIVPLTGRREAFLLAEKYETIRDMADAPIGDLTRYVGPAKAAKIKTVIRLANQLSKEIAPEKPLIDTPGKLAEICAPLFLGAKVESLWAALTNTRRRLIKLEKIADGILDTIVVHPRDVFRMAVIHNAAALVLFHNHPSGDPTPSDADTRITRELIRAGQMMKIDVLDHLIIGQSTMGNPRGYSSLRELGYFYN